MKSESQPMKESELGRYVCVPSSTCLHAPHTEINSDGVWVKTGQQWSSAHRDCFEARQIPRASTEIQPGDDALVRDLKTFLAAQAEGEESK